MNKNEQLMPATATPRWMDTRGKGLLHFGALLGLVMMLMLSRPEIYRIFVYLNVLIVLVYATSLWQDRSFQRAAVIIFAFPLAFTILHMLAKEQVDLVKEIRHIWLVGFACFSVLILLRQHARIVQPYLKGSLLGLLIAYCLAQVLAWLVFQHPYGTTKNPHYLALYSSIGMSMAIYLLTILRGKLKLVMIPVLLLLGTFVLHSSSRPAWLALILTGLLSILFLDGRKRLIAVMLILGIPVLLFFSNIDDFGDRSADLALNIQKEERVGIWQDAWRMQRASSPFQWVVGHGLDSYKDDFKPFSRYHGAMDFNSPHNSFLDVLYTSGIAGLALGLGFYCWLYRSLLRLMKRGLQYRPLALMLMAIATINVMFIGITIPFFAHYNTFTIAILAGLLLYLKEQSKREA